jgi:hypothetical protein
MEANSTFWEVAPTPDAPTIWTSANGTGIERFKVISFPEYRQAKASEGAAMVLDEIAQLHSFERLPPNWNSYNAKPVSRDAIAAATDLLMRVRGASGARPDVLAPVATGAIHMEWSGTDAEIEVRANPDMTFTYLRTIGDQFTERRTSSVYDVLAAVFATLAE